jgi:hypothetical protein
MLQTCKVSHKQYGTAYAQAADSAVRRPGYLHGQGRHDAASSRCAVCRVCLPGWGGGIEDAANLQGKPQTVWGCVCTGC